MIAIRGVGSSIATALRLILPAGESVSTVSRAGSYPPDAERYLICQGLLRSKRSHDQTGEEREEGYAVNCWQVTDACERIFAANPRARVCVIGSESGFSGSFDDIYADAKRLLHEYIERKKLMPEQQLICIAPSIIEDAGMTARREDTDNLQRRMALNPKRRFLQSTEVAALIHHALYVDQGYLTGTVIRMNGGPA